MANKLYSKARQKFLDGALSWSSDTIKAMLVDLDDYAVDLVNHEFLSDIPAGARISTSGALTGKTSADGVADADDVTFLGVSGDELEAVVLFKDTGVENTSALIAIIDTATGLPQTPTGGNLLCQWNNGADKIFKL